MRAIWSGPRWVKGHSPYIKFKKGSVYTVISDSRYEVPRASSSSDWGTILNYRYQYSRRNRQILGVASTLRWDPSRYRGCIWVNYLKRSRACRQSLRSDLEQSPWLTNIAPVKARRLLKLLPLGKAWFFKTLKNRRCWLLARTYDLRSNRTACQNIYVGWISNCRTRIFLQGLRKVTTTSEFYLRALLIWWCQTYVNILLGNDLDRVRRTNMQD